MHSRFGIGKVYIAQSGLLINDELPSNGAAIAKLLLRMRKCHFYFFYALVCKLSPEFDVIYA